MPVQFKSNVAAVRKQFDKNVNAALEAIGMEFTAKAMDEMDSLIYHAPLPPSAGPRYLDNARLGNLRARQTHQVNRSDKEVIVGNTADYAIHVTMPGITRDWDGAPFMQNALNNHQDDYEAVAKQVLGEGFD